MEHNESVRKFEHLMLKQADHSGEAAIELEARAALLATQIVKFSRMYSSIDLIRGVLTSCVIALTKS